MNKFPWIVLLTLLSLPTWGQATKDRNLAAIRRQSQTISVLPPRTGQNGQKDVNSQLDKLEHQTANTVIQPAAKSPKIQPYKLPPEPHAPTGSSYEQTMPVRAGIKKGAGPARSPNPSAKASLYGR